ncbi:hypothetical protein [Bacillus horti]|uniref:Secreted protein n=1 Tax=Caldalkalibacillus horti TaxID=77523 RepID=A0ABT9VZ49_9BACI|nr:hypothetical protein [Bacillus horti]MDQ0166269.1 hypothetical protein [Bacillus horti]
MKSTQAKKWMLYAGLYVALVIAAYVVYVNWIQEERVSHGHHSNEDIEGGHDQEKHDDHEQGEDEKQADGHGNHGGHGSREQSGGNGHGHGEHGAHTGESEVIPTVMYEEGEGLTIKLENVAGDPVTSLEMNHEKLMHLIVVSDDLESYSHVHPVEAGEGEFHIAKELEAGTYQVFVDIKPIDYGYHIEALPLQVGQVQGHKHASLTPSQSYIQTVDGVQVTLDTGTLLAGEEVTLSFVIENAEPEPYLGARGHIVILDEAAINFIHVHPVSDEETRFETVFTEPGLYKLWAEFQFEGNIHVYPFVLEVQ